MNSKQQTKLHVGAMGLSVAITVGCLMLVLRSAGDDMSLRDISTSITPVAAEVKAISAKVSHIESGDKKMREDVAVVKMHVDEIIKTQAVNYEQTNTRLQIIEDQVAKGILPQAVAADKALNKRLDKLDKDVKEIRDRIDCQ